MEREQRIGNGGGEAQGFAKTLEFLRRAIAEGAHLKLPERVSEDQWVRQKNVIGVYFGSPATEERLGDIYGVTRERIRNIKDRGLRNLWKNCSFETQILFPFKELVLKKSLPQRLRERMPLVRGSKNVELEINLRAAETDEEKQRLLNQVLRRFYQTHIKGENLLLMSIKTVAGESGFHYRAQDTKFFVEVLKAGGLPLGQIQEKTIPKGAKNPNTYSFILAKDKERVKEILLSDPDLQRFRRS